MSGSRGSLASPYDTAMLEFGSGKPDPRNKPRIADVTAHYAGSGFGLFARIAASDGIVCAVPAPGAASQLRSFFEKLMNGRARRARAGWAISFTSWTDRRARSVAALSPTERKQSGPRTA
jgi:aspartyl-tRNA synthetase